MKLSLILIILSILITLVSSQQSIDNSTYIVNLETMFNTLTLKSGTLVKFQAQQNGGDHMLMTKETPSGVVGFVSPVLGYYRSRSEFSYTFNSIGQYLIVDMYTNREMRLTIVDSQSSSTTTSTTPNPNTSTTTTGSKDSSQSKETTTNGKSSTATSTTTGGNSDNQSSNDNSDNGNNNNKNDGFSLLQIVSILNILIHSISVLIFF